MRGGALRRPAAVPVLLALLVLLVAGCTETPSVVLRLSRASIERMEAEEPELAAALHRRLAETLAERVSDALRAFDALLE